MYSYETYSGASYYQLGAGAPVYLAAVMEVVWMANIQTYAYMYNIAHRTVLEVDIGIDIMGVVDLKGTLRRA